MKEEEVILVDVNDTPVGTMPKMEAHEKAILHRAFSVFILNKEGQLMLQQRALHKYHSPGLWTNTCCSHQRMGETNLEAGARRLQEEMGFETPLEELFSFIEPTFSGRVIRIAAYFGKLFQQGALFVGQFLGDFHVHPHQLITLRSAPQ